MQINGEISVCLDATWFPEEHWTDLPAAVLSMWCDAVARLRSLESKSEDFFFMDGPYLFRVSQHGLMDYKIVLLERSQRGLESSLECIVECAALQREFVSACNTLVALATKRRWDCADLRKVREFIRMGEGKGDILECH
jgi:hypothetical protein